MARGHISAIRSGDMVGFGGCACSDWAIQLCTLGWPGWSLSHVAIAVEWPGHRWPVLVEATTGWREPCIVRGAILDGVLATRLRTRIVGYPGRVWHYPLGKPLSWIERAQLYGFCRERLGTSYDGLGALMARDTLWAATHRNPEDLHSYFCSEFVAAAHRECGRLPAQTNASAFSPNRLARMEVRSGVVHKPRRLK